MRLRGTATTRKQVHWFVPPDYVGDVTQRVVLLSVGDGLERLIGVKVGVK